jgi:hypothetical protein
MEGEAVKCPRNRMLNSVRAPSNANAALWMSREGRNG